MSQPYNVMAIRERPTLGAVVGPKDVRSAECRERMVFSRMSLIINYPFFGIIACRLQLVEDNIRCKTMATDGRHLFYNVGFVMGVPEEDRDEVRAKIKADKPDLTDAQIDQAICGLTDLNITAAIVHEIMHCMFEHFIRRNSRNAQKWNRAADYAINQIIVKELQAQKFAEIQSTWLYDKKYDGMVAEEIYPLLEDNDGDGDSWDDHPGQGQAGGNGGDDGDDRGTVGDIFGDITEAEMAEDMKSFRETVRSAAQAAKVPGDLQRMLDNATMPRIDWRTKVIRTLQSWMKRNMSFQRPSRRSWGTGCIFPGYLPEETIDICIALDMSGSITNEMAKEMLGEIVGMTKQFPSFRIKLLCFDTSVYNPQTFTDADINKLLAYRVKGGGGTDFDAVWEYMKAEKYKPKQLIMFTDGYPFGSWGDADYCETLFVIHGTTSIVAPFGGTVYYEFEGKHN